MQQKNDRFCLAIIRYTRKCNLEEKENRLMNVVRMSMLVTVGALVLFLSPSAHAELWGGGQAYYADSPSSICGPIDPYSPCYYPLSGSGDCPARTSYDSCMKRCDCQFNKNKEQCKQSVTCINLALSERNACYGACLSDFA